MVISVLSTVPVVLYLQAIARLDTRQSSFGTIGGTMKHQESGQAPVSAMDEACLPAFLLACPLP
jgi:hypothetical protein